MTQPTSAPDDTEDEAICGGSCMADEDFIELEHGRI